MALLNSKYLSVLGTFLLFCIPFQGVDGLNCYSCSSLENCYTSRSQIACKASEKNCEIKFDATDAIISMNCAETCDEAATCCTGDLCNKYLNYNGINIIAVATDSSANTASPNSGSTQKDSGTVSDSGADTNTTTTEHTTVSSSNTEKNSTDSGSSTGNDTTTAKPSSNGGNLVTSAMSAMALGIAFSLLSVY
ncbi:uncharacterized protein Dwil_GK27160 [Drosophila willistoni]|uniref:UPAR/Ly6 domain-containing protein n=1 Tax=Drosophila willistoni TaxID=7260 RepID=A0A0Q9X0I8_DROWI|nr:Y' element ATP-dependent helicase YLL067C [Drosophila willistoni]KRF98258.1 uncharacterized protein Dwil_GK27160 [Drosophila willistoni]